VNRSKKDIIAQLQKEIISLQSTPHPDQVTAPLILGPINQLFPNGAFPTAAVHEFISASNEDATATIGFVSGIVATLMKNKQAAIWISNQPSIFPPALKNFNIDPGHIIFIYLKKSSEILWATETAMKCEALSAVIADIPHLDFIASRRLQLAVEKSKVTGFILRQTNHKITPTACVSRWKIQAVASVSIDALPGVGFPKWHVQLLKIRNGKTGQWNVEWINGRYHFINESAPAEVQQNKMAI
jgi:protein ImuA